VQAAYTDTYENYEPYFLLMRTNTADVERRETANLKEWDVGPVGSVLVGRADGKDITPHQVETLALYCREKLEPGMKEVNEDSVIFGNVDEKGERRKFIKENMCQAKFEEFFEDLKKEKIEEGDESWADATSPYSV
jgi:hypothetical protein